MDERQGGRRSRIVWRRKGSVWGWLLYLQLLLCLPAHAQVQVRALEQEALTQGEPAPTPIIEAPSESETPTPLPIANPASSTTGIRDEIKSMQSALDERRAALQQTRERQAFAESLLARLNGEYSMLEQRLGSAGLDLSKNYAQLLRRRLVRLQQNHLAENLVSAIKEQLESARIEQFKLEEIEADIDPNGPPSDRLTAQRAQLVTSLRRAVDENIDVLTEYFQTITTLEDRIKAYQDLVRRRLFWLPSNDPVGSATFSNLAQAISAISNLQWWKDLVTAIPDSLTARWLLVLLLGLLLLALLRMRSRLIARLEDIRGSIGNVSRDRIGLSVTALLCSIGLALPGVLVFLLVGLALAQGGELGRALANGLIDAALVMFLFGSLLQIARPGGLAEQHFKWRPKVLTATRRGIPRLLMVLLPVTTLIPLSQSPAMIEYVGSFGRLIFTLASLALAMFLYRLGAAYRVDTPERSASKAMLVWHTVAVAIPLALAAVSLMGYHYTAVELEGTLFVSVCWLVFLSLLRYMGLRSLAVRERRMKLQRLREQRAKEQQLEAMLEASGSSGEGHPTTLDLPEMDLHHISAQSQAMLQVITLALAATGIWLLWAPIFPALNFLNEIVLWSVSDGGTTLSITLSDLGLSILVAVATIYGVRNLPGALEVMVLSRMQLAPGTGYAITAVVTYLIVIAGTISSLNILGADWSKLQWLVAALGVGLGFGLQEIVANFVSGIILLFERPIRVGDTVTIDGITGTVSRIRIRATTLVDWDRKEQIIPNKTFVTQDLTNWTLTDSITRVIIRVGVAYGSDVDHVRALLTQVALDNDRVVEEPPPAVFCVGLGDSSINYEVRAFVRSMLDIMPLSHEIHAAITRKLAEAGVEIPFPQRDIHIRTDLGRQ